MNGEKAVIKDAGDKGKGLFAITNIQKGEVIFNWEGELIYEAEMASWLPSDVRDHAIQFAPDKWIDTNREGRYSNHSCNPNAGIEGLFKLVALRDIPAGEEITWDYDTTENSDWVMETCRCGSQDCRKLIKGYRFLSKETKEKLLPYTSDWLKNSGI